MHFKTSQALQFPTKPLDYEIIEDDSVQARHENKKKIILEDINYFILTLAEEKLNSLILPTQS